jgi:hypothetical protein
VYGRQPLIEAYLGTRDHGGYYAESSAYNAALKAHHTAMLDGLEQLFGLRLDPRHADTFDNRVFLMLFNSTAASLVALRTPWSTFLEAGLLVKKVEAAGPDGARVMEASSRIETLTAESRRAHLDILDALVTVMLGDRADLTFIPADLHALGVDDTPPSTADHPLYDD